MRRWAGSSPGRRSGSSKTIAGESGSANGRCPAETRSGFPEEGPARTRARAAEPGSAAPASQVSPAVRPESEGQHGEAPNRRIGRASAEVSVLRATNTSSGVAASSDRRVLDERIRSPEQAVREGDPGQDPSTGTARSHRRSGPRATDRHDPRDTRVKITIWASGKPHATGFRRPIRHTRSQIGERAIDQDRRCPQREAIIARRGPRSDQRPVSAGSTVAGPARRRRASYQATVFPLQEHLPAGAAAARIRRAIRPAWCRGSDGLGRACSRPREVGPGTPLSRDAHGSLHELRSLRPCPR